MSHYVLPDLPYDYGALEPHISGKIIELHHDKHHAAYVKGANQALERMAEARDNEDFTRIAAFERMLAFHLSGHVLHSLLWQNLTGEATDRPTGELAAQIERDFSAFAKLKRQMNEAAASIMGSGWAALVWEPIGHTLLVTQIYDHQSNLNQGGVPLMVIDAWEHAYYLQYQTRKSDYFEALWNLWNWDDIAARYESARTLDVGLSGASAK